MTKTSIRVYKCKTCVNVNLVKQMQKESRIEFVSYSMPCAKIITRPGSTIMSSLMCALSQASTSTACLPGTRLHTQFSYWRRLFWRVSSAQRPGGQRRSWQFSIRSSIMCEGHPISLRTLLIIRYKIFMHFLTKSKTTCLCYCYL